MVLLRRWLLSATGTGILSIIVSWLVAVRDLPVSTWLSRSDLPGFLLLTVAYSLLVIAISLLVRRSLALRGAFLKAIAALLIGATVGLVWTIGAIWLLWSYVRDIGFPIIDSWQAGGAAGFLLMFFSMLGREDVSRGQDQPSTEKRGIPRLVSLSRLSAGFLFALAVLYSAGLYTYWNLLVETEIYLVPQGYEGPVLVVFEQPSGVPAEYEGRARRYTAPTNGVLLTQVSRVKHAYQAEFFYVDEGGVRTRLFYRDGCSQGQASEMVIVCPVGQQTEPPTRGFIIASPNQQGDYYQEFEEVLSATLNNLPPEGR
jgi:hypothetical protein